MATTDHRRRRRLPTNLDDLKDLVARFSDEHAQTGAAAEALLAEYSVSRAVYYQLAYSWVIEMIDRLRRPEAYAADEEY